MKQNLLQLLQTPVFVGSHIASFFHGYTLADLSQGDRKRKVESAELDHPLASSAQSKVSDYISPSGLFQAHKRPRRKDKEEADTAILASKTDSSDTTKLSD